MRLRSHIAACTALLLTTPAARADDRHVCAEAYTQAQVLRREVKLLESRAKLLVCSRTVCTDFITEECTEWLAQVEARIPSVVLEAKDGDGAELLDVKVSMDGAVIATRLDGRAVEVNPGLHTFVFQGRDGTRTEAKVAIKEGAKAQAVAIVLGQPKVKPDRLSGRTMRILGYSAGGLGVISLGIGGFFGLRAIVKNDESKNDCDAQDVCRDAGLQARNDAQSAAAVSTIAVGVGGVLLAGGVALVLLAPSNRKAAMVRVAPMVGASGGGMLVVGRF